MSSYENVVYELEENGYESACEIGARTYRKLETRAGHIATRIYELQMLQLELDKESESVYALLAKLALTESESVCSEKLGTKAECFDYYFGEEPHSSYRETTTNKKVKSR